MSHEPNSKSLTEKSQSNPTSSRDIENFTIPQLISFLKSSYKKTDFDQVQSILISREIQIKKSLLEDLSSKEDEWLELKKKLGDLRTKCVKLEEEVKNIRNGSYNGNVGKSYDGFAWRRLQQEVSMRKSKFKELEKHKGKSMVIEVSDSDDDGIDANKQKIFKRKHGNDEDGDDVTRISKFMMPKSDAAWYLGV